MAEKAEKAEKTEATCVFCGKRATRGGMSRHLRMCAARAAAIAEADGSAGKPETLIHLQVQDPWVGQYWLHLEMRGSARLQKLDDYLRAIWLECCGHLSQFNHGGWADEVAMGRPVQAELGVGQSLTHVYDFGSTTRALIVPLVNSPRTGVCGYDGPRSRRTDGRAAAPAPAPAESTRHFTASRRRRRLTATYQAGGPHGSRCESGAAPPL